MNRVWGAVKAQTARLEPGDAAVAVLALATCAVVVANSHFVVDGARQFTLVDDAMISLRYAKNLAQGHGLVWNVGESPIEGFTNLGYTLMMTPGFVFGDTVFSRYFAVLLTTAGFVATALLTAAITRAIWPGSRVTPTVAGAMVALNFGLIFWATRGMETPLVTAAVLAMTLQLIRWRHDQSMRRLWVASLWGAIAIVLRLDSSVLVLTVAMWIIACELFARRSVRGVLVAPAVAIGTTVAVLAFQALYFGDALPNTYRLKIEGVSVWERAAVGWHALNDYARPELLVLFVLGPVLIALFSPSTLRDAGVWTLILIAAVSIAYAIWTGGDYIEPNRFILTGIPGLCALAAVGVSALSARLRPILRGHAASPLLGVIAIALVLMPNFGDLRTLIAGNNETFANDERRTALALHLRSTLPPDTIIATHAAGQIPYYSNLQAIDLLGLNDRRIAAMSQTSKRFRPGHTKWNYPYSIGELNPDVIVEEWGQVRKFLESHGGYKRLPNGIWVSIRPRTKIDVDKLGACYWQCDK